MSIIIVVGEQACGKTRNKEKIKDFFDATMVFDSGNLLQDLDNAKSFTCDHYQQSIQRTNSSLLRIDVKNENFGKKVVVLTNESVPMSADYRRVDAIVHYRSLNLE